MAKSAKPKVYHYPKCSTCKKALKWLDQHEIAHTRVDIVERPPSARELARVKKLAGVELRKLFNTSGKSYRGGGWKDKLPGMSEAEALAALAADGKLIKRPILIAGEVALVGFREADWQAALLQI